jgi:hypothetical protein
MKRKYWIQAGLIAVAVLCGCASQDSGYRISNETVAFIRPGVTTRTEVVENLGPPLFELKDPHVVAYSWGKVHGTVSRAAVSQSANPALRPSQSGYAPEPAAPEETGTVESHRWICCVALGPQDRVTRFGTFEVQGATSLENAVRQWAAQGQ